MLILFKIPSILIDDRSNLNKAENDKQHTVSGPTTFVGGGIDRKVFLNSGPGLFRDKRFLAVDCDDDIATFPSGFAAKSSP